MKTEIRKKHVHLPLDYRATSRDADYTRSSWVLYSYFMLKILEQVNFMFFISFQFGMSWMTLCYLIEDYRGTDYSKSYGEYPATFLTYFSLYDKTDKENAILATYYAYTSLSTVGFGDLNPRDDIERVFIAFMLLLGVAIFSLVMGNFIAIIELYNEYESDFNDGN